MINILVFSCAFIFSLVLFQNAYCTNGVLGVVDSYSLAHAQNAVSSSPSQKEPPFFIETEFMRITDRYFETNLFRYLGENGDWKVDYLFDDEKYEKYLNKDMLFDKYPQSARFVITVNVNGLSKITRAKTFLIKEGKAYGW